MRCEQMTWSWREKRWSSDLRCGTPSHSLLILLLFVLFVAATH